VIKPALKKYPYLYDLVASILTVIILLLSANLSRGGLRILTFTGLLFLATACLLWILALIHLKKYGKVEQGRHYYDTQQVVEEGVYAVVRHPQYLAYICLVIGFALMSQHWLIYILAFSAVVLFVKHTEMEEEELTDKFKQNYLLYRQVVPRLNIIKGIIRYVQKY
jgi:protein-S-isoprenylcysteine O-methyltransferase Ste14